MIKFDRKYYLKKVGLFLLTFISTTFAGIEWTTNKSVLYSENVSWTDVEAGLHYAVPFLLILTIHEFGHYFTAKYHKVAVTLPNYLPGWLGFIPGMMSFGTFGALIKIIGPIKSRKQYFDIGVSGPIAGFIAAFILLWYGFANLPTQDYIYEIHPEYAQYGDDYAEYVYEEEGVINLKLGTNLLFEFFKSTVAEPERLPNPYEIIHYPYLFAGFMALFFTALNLLPMGQLDGGHVLYGLFGYKIHAQLASILYLVFAFFAGIGIVSIKMPLETILWSSALYIGFLYICFKGLGWTKINTLMAAVIVFALQYFTSMIYPDFSGFNGYLLFVFLVGRLIGVKHPKAYVDQPLSNTRKIVGWIALIIFLVSFSLNPFEIIANLPEQ